MYTEDGFELRAVGDTLEVYASGELFHEPSPPVLRAFSVLATHSGARRALCDIRQATYVLEDDEADERARMTAGVLAGLPTAFVGLGDQQDFVARVIANLERLDTPAALFSSKQAARDWLEGREPRIVPGIGRAPSRPLVLGRRP